MPAWPPRLIRSHNKSSAAAAAAEAVSSQPGVQKDRNAVNSQGASHGSHGGNHVRTDSQHARSVSHPAQLRYVKPGNRGRAASNVRTGKHAHLHWAADDDDDDDDDQDNNGNDGTGTGTGIGNGIGNGNGTGNDGNLDSDDTDTDTVIDADDLAGDSSAGFLSWVGSAALPPKPRRKSDGKRLDALDIETGACLVCASVVKWPKELRAFRCATCLTVNDLDSHLRPSRRRPVQEPDGAGRRPDGAARGPDGATRGPDGSWRPEPVRRSTVSILVYTASTSS